MTLGERVKKAREHAELSRQEDLVAKIKKLYGAGPTQQSIDKIERDKTKNSKFIVQIASACGVSPWWLGSEKGPMVISTVDHGPDEGAKNSVYFPKDAYKRLAKLVTLWAVLTDDAQELVLQHVEEVAEAAQHGCAPPPVRLRSKKRTQRKTRT